MMAMVLSCCCGVECGYYDVDYVCYGVEWLLWYGVCAMVSSVIVIVRSLVDIACSVVAIVSCSYYGVVAMLRRVVAMV